MSDIREQIARLSPEQRKQFLQRLQQEVPPTPTRIQHIPRRADSTQVPLSFGQQGMWLLDQLEPGNPLFTLTPTMRLIGPLDIAALAHSLNMIIARHEVLRATFPALEGQPVQLLAPQLTIPLPVTDLRSYAPAQRETLAQEALDAAIAYHFDLARGPLICARLLQLADDDHILTVTMHHIVTDGWSLGVLIQELVALYVAQTTKRPAALTALPIQYADFAAWQRARLQGAFLEAQLGYWRTQLAEVPVLQLPTDYARPAVQRYRSATLPFTLTPALTTDLKALSRRAGTTLYMTQFAAFAVLLSRLSGQLDFCIGSVVAGRTQPELEELIGFFVNNLALRVDLRGQPSVEALLRQVRAITLGAYDHQDVPFELVLEAVQPTRDTRHSPLFQTMCVMQNFPRPHQVLPELVLHPLYTASRRSGFDLAFWFWEAEDGIAAELEYNPTLFATATIQRIAGQLHTLLRQFVVSPARPVDALLLLSAAEQHQLLVEWNVTATTDPADACLPTLFMRQVARTPDAIAVSSDAQHLTYDELHRRVNQLAQHLRGLGVGPEVLVGVYVPRGLEMLLALLAVSTAGGAYLPLDPVSPAARLAFMLEDAQVGVLITSAADTQTRRHADTEMTTLLVSLPPCLDTVVDLAADWPQIAQQPACSLATTVQPSSLAYVIYTSGSTGRPKGVQIPQRALVNLLTSMRAEAGMTARDVLLAVTTVSFDIAALELFLPLTVGAQVVIASHAIAIDGAQLDATLARCGITVMQATPTTWQLLLAVGWSGDDGLRILCGGEALPSALADRLRSVSASVWNVYGPTETTIWSTATAVTPSIGPLAIGRPIANTTVYLLNGQMKPVPIGVAGELYIGGVGLARGYRARPDLTAERFVPNPFAEVSGVGCRMSEDEFPDTRYLTPDTRLYKTGDLARYQPDGQIVYLGRIDQQIKLRGYRIELGEIATVLGQHPDVRECVVIARPQSADEQRLIAYVVPQPADPDSDPQGAAWAAAQVEHWQTLYDETYRQTAASPDATFNIIGWNSSYTDQPIPAAEMREWVEQTVVRIQALRPQRVLEIGCGSGLLLFRLAPDCAEYVGTDFSAAALDYLRQQPALNDLPQVRLLQRTADDFSELAPGFDLVILNSVVQYFPSVGYLARVLAGALDVLAPGGALFVGDVRNRPLLATFQAVVQLQHAAPTLSLATLRQLLTQALAQEEELVLDPAFFGALATTLPLASAQVQLKRGWALNELTQFRYDVLLRKAPAVAVPLPPRWQDWDAAGLTLAALRTRLVTEASAQLALAAVPNARLVHAEAALAWLDRGTAATVADLIATLPASEPGVEPEALWALGAELGYTVAISVAQGGRRDACDVVFQRATTVPDASGWTAQPALAVPLTARPWASYANMPLQGQFTRRLAPLLRRTLADQLPDYMIPSAFVLLDRFPLTVNGKLDRRALPAPTAHRLADERLVAPRTPLEVVLAGIWAEVLSVAQVGIDDNFFTLGGHSLRATQVIARIRDVFHLELPLSTLFEAPTVASLAAQLERSQRARTGRTAPPLLPTVRVRRLPLSFAQSRLWFLDQFAPGSATYSISTPVRLIGTLDLIALHAGFCALIRRHETLRTSFWVVDGQPTQVIAPAATLPLALLDLRGLPVAERQAAAQQAVRAEARVPFDLARGPLMRTTLLRLDAQEHLVLVTMHHIISDGWSVGVLIRDLAALYVAAISRQPVVLPALPIQYADYAIWQQQWLQGELLDAQLAYWQGQLADAPPTLDLPLDRPRPSIQTFRGAQQRVVIPTSLHDTLQMLSRCEGVTLFMTLLAAFQLVLARHSGQQDLVVGSPIANRTQRATEGLIGFFVNTLVLRTDLRGNPTFLVLLQRVREVCLAAYTHQDLPFEQLVDVLQPERDLSRHPLFQVLFVLQDAPLAALDVPGLTLQPVSVETQTAKFDLSLSINETTAGLVATWEYNIDLFDTATITRLVRHFQTLLTGSVADPARPISDLPLLTLAEQQQLREWNATTTADPATRTLNSWVAAYVARTPDAVVVAVADMHLTYRDLDQRANQLAHTLRACGVGPDVPVGLCIARSLAMTIGLLGILKAGGALVPLDPSYPAERLAFMCADAQLALLLTQHDLRDRLPMPPERLICLDTAWPLIAQAPTRAPVDMTHLDHLLYVIYTSGSTGRPKGIAMSHRALLNLLWWQAYTTSRPGPQATLQFAPLSFDVAIQEIMLTWGTGGTLVLITEALRQEPAALLRLLTARGITRLFLPFVALQQLATVVRPDSAGATVREIITAGEQLQISAAIATWLGVLPTCTLENQYGPSESHAVTDERLPRDRATWPLLPTIGRPIANTQVYLLDAHMQQVPIGVPGELYIGGANLARGYLRRPDQTAERFVPNPFAEVSGAGYRVSGDKLSGTRYPTPATRLYRTGDLARYQADGRIAFLGRIDGQVKLRGYRIEPGEIEAALRQHPTIGAAVVLARTDSLNGTRLVAYVVPQQGSGDRDQGSGAPAPDLLTPDPRPLIPDLRSFLQARLPEYMVPSAYVVLTALPLTPSGKLDYRALPAPTAQRASDAPLVTPRTPIEEVISGIWAEVLGVAQVGVDDNFFTLGGHSLLATQAIARIHDTFQIELPLRMLFETPTVTGLATQLERSRIAHSGLSVPLLVPAQRSGPLPLSFAQSRLWFLEQLNPGSATYSIPTPVRLIGVLDLAALHASFSALIRRHETLRTTFSTVDGQPAQVIAAPSALPLPQLDLRGLPLTEREQTAQQAVRTDARTPFDLARGPLMRTTLLRLDDQTQILLVTMHHIISDGWSVGVLIRDLVALYIAATSGQSTPLPALPIQYADYAAWQQHWLQGEVLDAHVGYWTHQLADTPPTLDLPLDRPRPPTQTFRGAQQTQIVPAPLLAELQVLSRREGVTLFMTLLATFQLLLVRYSGQDDIVVGSPIANRTQRATEDLIGFFVNTLALRTDLSGNPTVRAVFQRVRTVCLSAYAHQDLPFEQLVDAMQPERDLSRHPLFQVMLTLQNAPISALVVPGLTLEPVVVDTQTAKFDLSLSVNETAAGLVATWQYASDLFDAATIVRMGKHFQILLTGIVADSSHPLAQLSLLTSHEQQQLLVEWNATEVNYPQARCVHELFAAQARRTPDAIALVFDATMDERAIDVTLSALPHHLTYRELNARANQLAHQLRALGVGLETRVGICVERSLETPIAFLGVFKAGAAYVPLDPAYPPERISFMLADTQAAVLLTQRHLLDHLPELSLTASSGHQSGTHIPHRAVLCLDADWPAISQASDQNLANEVTPDNLAYVMYTSGSTGTPKGVMVPHRGVGNRVLWMRELLGLTDYDRVLHKASFGFDASVWEMFLPLTTGARLVVAPPRAQHDNAHLVELTIREQLTMLHFVPWLLKPFLEQPGLEACRSVRRVWCGGEAMPLELQQRFSSRLAADLYNGYGPTEGTINATYWPCERENRRGMVPIGRPIANYQIYILDAQLRLVPIGVAGELYIGGIGVARGYMGRPDLTAEKFIPNPFLKDESGRRKAETAPFILPPASFRLYRTGDLARYQSDGSIEYLRRADQQVKLRGVRIEPGEVEAVLGSHPSVRESCVLVREDQPGETRLVAYVVEGSGVRGQGSDEPASEVLIPAPRSLIPELREFLAARLPSSMMPSAFVVLDALPLMPNGKLNRRALPAPDLARSALEQRFAAPRTPTEELLAEIWSTVLGVARVGVNDNFFALGGHSLLATQVVARIQTVLGATLPVRRLFEAPTITALAPYVEAARGAGQAAPPAIRPVPRDGPLPLSFAQQRLWFLDQFAPASAAYTIPAAVSLQGLLHLPALMQSFTTLIQRHETLRTTFATVDGSAIQLIAPQAVLPLRLADLTALVPEQREAAVSQLVSAEAQLPFDLARGPLLRIVLLRLASDQHVLLLTMHHIISDGWSIGVLVRELAALYAAYTTGQPSPLLPLPIQYADYAVWQRHWLQGADDHAGSPLQTQLAYWKAQLASAPPVLELPTDRPRPARQSFRGAVLPLVLPSTLSADLLSLSRREGVTLFMTLLAAFQVLLARYSGQDSIVVGSPIANRTQQATEALIGFFVNTLVLCTDLSGNPSFGELLGRVRRLTLDAYTYQDLPFEKLVEELQPERDLSRTPLFQVLFVLQNAPLDPVELPDVTLHPLELPSATAKFDLSLALNESTKGLLGAWEYNTDMFDATTITRMQQHFQTLLAGIVAAPEAHIGLLPLLTEQERQQLLVDWNASQRVEFQHDCLHQRFEAQVARTPDAVALTCERQQLTYHELNARANQLAHTLRAAGVGPDTLVALSVERSLEMLIGILGILKAGGAYLPLDPTYPPARLTYMLEDSRAKMLITNAGSPDKEIERQGDKESDNLLVSSSACLGRVLDLLADWPAIACQPRTNLSHTTLPQHLAYVIYTSGSTGTPKGVLVSHANVVRLLAATQASFQFDADEVWSLFHSYAFDFSVWEIWGAFAYGGRLVVVPYWLSRTPDALYTLLSCERVTVLNQTASAFGQLMQLEASREQPLPLALRWIIFGGEALVLRRLKPWFERHGDQMPQIVNMYGITETTVHVTYRRICAADVDGLAESVIGGAIADLQICVLDRQLQLVPIGVSGELCIGGAGLARGYLGRPDLTAERFVPNPFAEDRETRRQGDKERRDCAEPQSAICNLQSAIGSRLYRSGDRARYLANGDLEYLGRLDQQVKIRGFRIELGEIEAVLRQHPAVREAVVLAQQEAAEALRLVAYLLVEQPTPALTELRNFVQATVPEYMLPAAFVLRDSLPLTANGKVDRRALAASSSGTKLSFGAAYAAPRTEIETLLVNAWQKVLEVTPIGIQDNYFALGGDSIRVIQMLHELKQYHISATVLDLFQHQTIELLAQHLAMSQRQAENAIPLDLVRIPEPIRDLLPPDIEDAYLTARMQELMLFHYATNAQNTGIYHVQQSFQIYSIDFSIEMLHSALALLVQKHVILRTVFFTAQVSRPIQIVKKALAFSITVDDIRTMNMPAQERHIRRAMQQDRIDLFDTNDLDMPLFRFKVFLRSEATFEFLMSIHHALDDGWGNVEFLKELVDIYLSLRSGEDVVIIAPANSYKEFVALEQAIIASKEALQFWNTHLSNYTHQPLQQRASWCQDTSDGNELHIFDKALTSRLAALSQRLDCSLKAIFLRAYLALIQEVSGADVVTAGVVVNGRSARLSDPLKALGLFWNIIPLCYQSEEGDTDAQLRNVQQLLIDVEPYASYPLLELLEQRQEAELFFATFNFLHFHNLKTITQDADVRIVQSGGHDRFHFPLNTTITVAPFDSQVTMRIEYDSRYFSRDSITAMVNTYVDVLKSLLLTDVLQMEPSDGQM